jgi:hypothetical protein
MRRPSHLATKDRRGDQREEESSKLLVRGRDAHDHPFEEQTATCEISGTGVSFYLQTPIRVGSQVSIQITKSVFFGHLHTAHAQVVRLESDTSGRQFVGARFL